MLLNLIVIASSNNLKPLGLTRLEVVSLNLSSAQYKTTLKQFDLIEWPHVLQQIIFQTFLFPNPNSLYWQTVHRTLPAVLMVMVLSREWWTVIDGFLHTSLVGFYLFTWCTFVYMLCRVTVVYLSPLLKSECMSPLVALWVGLGCCVEESFQSRFF